MIANTEQATRVNTEEGSHAAANNHNENVGRPREQQTETAEKKSEQRAEGEERIQKEVAAEEEEDVVFIKQEPRSVFDSAIHSSISSNSNNSHSIHDRLGICVYVGRLRALQARDVITREELNLLTQHLSTQIRQEEAPVLHILFALEQIAKYCPHMNNNHKSEPHIGMFSQEDFDRFKRALVSASNRASVDLVVQKVEEFADTWAYNRDQLDDGVMQAVKQTVFEECGISVPRGAEEAA